MKTRFGTMYQSADVVLIPFPFSDLRTSKKRPVLVLRPADSYGDMVCLAITSRSNHQESVSIHREDFIEGVLPQTSLVRYGKVYTINESIVVCQFGTLKQDIFDKIHGYFCQYFAC